MSPDPYSPGVRRLFERPDHAGRLAGATEAYVEGQGVRIHLMASCRDGRIGQIRFLAWGCPHLLAACEMACADLEGRSVAELSNYEITARMKVLGMPVEKTGRILVLEDAIRSLANALRPAAESDSSISDPGQPRL